MTTPTDEWRRAGRIVAERMNELGLTVTQLAAKAQVHPSTVRALINAGRPLNTSTRERIMTALGWSLGEVGRRVYGPPRLEDVPTEDLTGELCRRFNRGRHAREK